jgi:hypothetical protein
LTRTNSFCAHVTLLFRRSRKQIALSTAPGGYSQEDPEGIIFDRGTHLRVELNHQKILCFLLAANAGDAVWARQPPSSVVKSDGISADAGGQPLIRPNERTHAQRQVHVF